jgi:hypothetical protein
MQQQILARGGGHAAAVEVGERRLDHGQEARAPHVRLEHEGLVVEPHRPQGLVDVEVEEPYLRLAHASESVAIDAQELVQRLLGHAGLADDHETLEHRDVFGPEEIVVGPKSHRIDDAPRDVERQAQALRGIGERAEVVAGGVHHREVGVEVVRARAHAGGDRVDAEPVARQILQESRAREIAQPERRGVPKEAPRLPLPEPFDRLAATHRQIFER